MYKQIAKKKQRDSTSILFWLLAGMTTLFLFWAPFQKALFNGNTVDFERPIYTALIWGFIILLLLAFYLFNHWDISTHQDVVGLLIWFMPISYVLAKFAEASHYFSTNMVFIQTFYAIAFIVGLYVAKSQIGLRILTQAFLWSGYLIVWFGVVYWFGFEKMAVRLIGWFTYLPNGKYLHAVMEAEGELRLTAVFQYANTYAAFLMALLLAVVYVISDGKKSYYKAVHAFMLVPIIISFILTLSRGGLVLLPVLILLILPFIALHRQLMILIHLVISGVATLLILSRTTAAGEAAFRQDLSQSTGGIWALMGVSLAVAVLIWLLQAYVYPLLQRGIEHKVKWKFANIIVPGVSIIAGALGLYLLLGNTFVAGMLPESIKQRVDNINFAQHSVLERLTMYKDAVKLFSDYPVTGAGGGAWAALYEKYQNNPYAVRQAHNFFLQYLAETGIVGILILIGLLGYVLIIFWHQYRTNKEAHEERYLFFIVVISLLVHSIMDFDMSYVYISGLVFLCLGAMISGHPFMLKRSFEGLVRYKWVYPAVMAIFSLIMFFNAAQMLSANSLYREAYELTRTGASMEEILPPLNKALDYRPEHPDYAALKIDLLLSGYSQTNQEQYYTEASQLLNLALDKEPYNRSLIERHINMYSMKDQTDKALEIVNAEFGNFPWDITLYEKKIAFLVGLGDKARLENNSEQRDTYWNEAMETYNLVMDRAKILESLPEAQGQGREFGLTPSMGQALGQMEYIKGNYPEAETFLKAAVNPDHFNDEPGRIAARWYLAALQKQGKNDQGIYDQLIAADPNEKNQIEGLLIAKF